MEFPPEEHEIFWTDVPFVYLSQTLRRWDGSLPSLVFWSGASCLLRRFPLFCSASSSHSSKLQLTPLTQYTHSPIWNFDGSSTGQAPGDDSEVLLKPQAIFPDPFRGGKNILVMCDCYKPDMTPIKNNTRLKAAELMKKAADLVPWFGIEQEYTLFEADGVTPFGWPKGK